MQSGYYKAPADRSKILRLDQMIYEMVVRKWGRFLELSDKLPN